MRARIFLPPKNAMQSGRAGTDWVLIHPSAAPRRPDPLMGWSGSGDTQVQVVLKFASAEDALAYAEKYGIDAHVSPTPPRRLKLQSYADNFR